MIYRREGKRGIVRRSGIRFMEEECFKLGVEQGGRARRKEEFGGGSWRRLGGREFQMGEQQQRWRDLRTSKKRKGMDGRG